MISVIFLLAQTKTLSRQQISDQTQNLLAFDLHLATDQKPQNPPGLPPTQSLTIRLQKLVREPLTPSHSLVSVFCNAVVCQQIETSDLRSGWLSTGKFRAPSLAKSLFSSPAPPASSRLFYAAQLFRPSTEKSYQALHHTRRAIPVCRSSSGRTVKLVHKATLRHYNPSVSLAPLWSSALSSSHIC